MNVVGAIPKPYPHGALLAILAPLTFTIGRTFLRWSGLFDASLLTAAGDLNPLPPLFWNTLMAMPGLSPAASDLGLGDQLSQQVAGETEEERKKWMTLLAQNRMLGPSGSPSVAALFGAGAGRGSAGY